MDWNFVVEIAKEINLAQLIVIGLMFCFFYSRLDGKIQKLSDDIKDLRKDIQDIDKRLCRLEGASLQKIAA